MKAFTLHLRLELVSGLRNKTLLFMSYLFPVGFAIMMGLIMSGINPMFLETMVPAMAIFAALSGIILGMPEPLVSAREAGIFRSYHIYGVPAKNIVIAPALSMSLHALVATAIILLAVPLMFSATRPENLLWFFAVAMVLLFNLSGLGALISVVSANSRATILWSQLVFLPSMMLSGMMFPSQMLPENMARVGRLLPGAYAMEAFNVLSMGGRGDYSPWLALAVLLAGGLLAYTLALYLFSWDTRYTKRPSLLLALLALLPYVLGAVMLPLSERIPLG